MNTQPRLRMFAGPNGSGKSTLKSVISPNLLGVYGEVQRAVVELKLKRGALEKVIADGIKQTNGYADSVEAKEQYLVIFDRTPNTPWEEKVWQKEIDGLLVLGC